jgi:hypothetical protein
MQPIGGQPGFLDRTADRRSKIPLDRDDHGRPAVPEQHQRGHPFLDGELTGPPSHAVDRPVRDVAKPEPMLLQILEELLPGGTAPCPS